MTPPSSEPAPRPDKSIPLWAGIATLCVLLITGLAVLWKYVYGPPRPPNKISVITPAPGAPRVATQSPATPGVVSAAGALLAGAEAELADGAYPRSDGQVLFKAGDAYVRAAPGANGGPDELRFGYFTVTEAEWEHGYLSQGVRRMLDLEDVGREMGLTADQAERLRALPAAPDRTWSPPARAGFAERFAAWRGATSPEARAAATRSFVEALAAYAGPKRSAEQAAMADRIRRIKGVLTDRQAARINPIPRWDFAPSAPINPN